MNLRSQSAKLSRTEKFTLLFVSTVFGMVGISPSAHSMIQKHDPVKGLVYQPSWAKGLGSNRKLSFRDKNAREQATQRRKILTQTNNSSYFTNYSHGIDRDREFNQLLMSDQEAKHLQQTLRDMNRDYELRSQYGLSNRDDDWGFMDRMKNFARWIVRKIFRDKLNQGIENTKKATPALRTFEDAQKTVNKVMRPNLDVGSSEGSSFYFKMGTKANFPKQEGRVWFNSDIVNGAVDVKVGKPWGFDPGELSKVEVRNEPDESYRLSISRGLPIWSLQTGLSYGGTTKTMTTSVSKSLTRHLNVSVSNKRSFDHRVSPLPPAGEHLLQLNYGMRF